MPKTFFVTTGTVQDKIEANTAEDAAAEAFSRARIAQPPGAGLSVGHIVCVATAEQQASDDGVLIDGFALISKSSLKPITTRQTMIGVLAKQPRAKLLSMLKDLGYPKSAIEAIDIEYLARMCVDVKTTSFPEHSINPALAH